RDDDVAARLPQSAQRGRLLSEIAGELQRAHARRAPRQPLQRRPDALVRRAVVDEDDLVIVGGIAENRLDARRQQLQGRAVVNGHDDGDEPASFSSHSLYTRLPPAGCPNASPFSNPTTSLGRDT